MGDRWCLPSQGQCGECLGRRCLTEKDFGAVRGPRSRGLSKRAIPVGEQGVVQVVGDPGQAGHDAHSPVQQVAICQVEVYPDVGAARDKESRRDQGDPVGGGQVSAHRVVPGADLPDHRDDVIEAEVAS